MKRRFYRPVHPTLLGGFTDLGLSGDPFRMRTYSTPPSPGDRSLARHHPSGGEAVNGKLGDGQLGRRGGRSDSWLW